MESKAGSILALIGAILTFIMAAISLIITIVIFVLTPLEDKIGNGVPLTIVGIIFIGVFIYLIIGGIVKLYASRLMKSPKTTTKGGIIAIIAGILVSDIFTLIGGVIGVVQGSQK